MKNIYEDENITDITQEDVFEYSDINITDETDFEVWGVVTHTIHRNR